MLSHKTEMRPRRSTFKTQTRLRRSKKHLKTASRPRRSRLRLHPWSRIPDSTQHQDKINPTLLTFHQNIAATHSLEIDFLPHCANCVLGPLEASALGSNTPPVTTDGMVCYLTVLDSQTACRLSLQVVLLLLTIIRQSYVH